MKQVVALSYYITSNPMETSLFKPSSKKTNRIMITNFTYGKVSSKKSRRIMINFI